MKQKAICMKDLIALGHEPDFDEEPVRERPGGRSGVLVCDWKLVEGDQLHWDVASGSEDGSPGVGVTDNARRAFFEVDRELTDDGDEIDHEEHHADIVRNTVNRGNRTSVRLNPRWRPPHDDTASPCDTQAAAEDEEDDFEPVWRPPLPNFDNDGDETEDADKGDYEVDELDLDDAFAERDQQPDQEFDQEPLEYCPIVSGAWSGACSNNVADYGRLGWLTAEVESRWKGSWKVTTGADELTGETGARAPRHTSAGRTLWNSYAARIRALKTQTARTGTGDELANWTTATEHSRREKKASIPFLHYISACLL
ncbi:hypothetical protein HK102_004243 [Quaeritorhiza haematococci]|nr:hypothetical protein HK102_004243 [Quaeritorhiza haematococci]